MFEGRRRRNRHLIGIITSAAILAGCTAPSDGLFSNNASEGGIQTATQQNFYEKKRNFNNTVWGGVATGAVIGGLSGWLIGGDVKGALIGAGAGAFAGGAAGSYVASKQRAYSNQEDVLDSMIADIRSKNAETEALVASMVLLVEEDKQKLAELESQQRAKQTDDTAHRQLAQIRRDREAMGKVIADADEQLGVFRKSGQIFANSNVGADMGPYNSEVESMERKIDNMRALVEDLSAEELG